MAVRLIGIRAPHAPHLRLRLGVAALVALTAVPGVMAARPSAVVSAPSVEIGLAQPGR